jgi:hypothetical protein
MGRFLWLAGLALASSAQASELDMRFGLTFGASGIQPFAGGESGGRVREGGTSRSGGGAAWEVPGGTSSSSANQPAVNTNRTSPGRGGRPDYSFK